MILKIIFTWWNKQTIGTFLKTFFTGKFVGKDELGNKYYKNKRDERWVIYSNSIEPTKINSDWFLWIHHTIDKVPGKLEKNIHGKRIILKTEPVQMKVINRQKLEKMLSKKNMTLGNKINYFFIIFILVFIKNLYAEEKNYINTSY